VSDRLLRGALAVTLALLVVAVAALLTTRRDVSRLSARVDELSTELADTRSELAAEQTATETATEPAGIPGLEDLLGGLLGEGGEGLGDLFGGSAADLAACVAGEGLGGGPVQGTDAAAQIADITARVETIRGLQREEEIEVTFLSTPEIQERVRQTVLTDYPVEEADLDRRQLAALGAIPADLDLRATQAELVSGQVAGFYEPESGQLVVRSDDPAQPLGPTEQVTLAHEVEHALADQVLGLDIDQEDQPADAQRAGLALIEGDAVLTQQRFTLAALDVTQQLGLATDPAVIASQQQLESFPHVLGATLLFSYTEGLNFVCSRYADGGWQGVDAAYGERPQTTAEILFPERYPARPAEPRAHVTPEGGWTQARRDSFGAADLLWLFEAPGDREAASLDDPRGRAGDWTGGLATLYTRGDDSALGLALSGQARLCDSITTWYDAAFPDATGAPAEGAELARDGATQDAVVACDGTEVRIGIAPDLQAARALTR
jgi:hypothetical protein